jgi:hypothetical protein
VRWSIGLQQRSARRDHRRPTLDGSSAEAVYHGRLREGRAIIDHLRIRVTDLAETRRFCETLALLLGLGIRGTRPERFHVTADDVAFVLDPAGNNVEAVHHHRSPK